jgi:hypothetical protein
MVDFEAIGRKVNREVEKLKVFLDRELKPSTKRGTVEALRTAASRLNELADDCEKRWKESQK